MRTEAEIEALIRQRVDERLAEILPQRIDVAVAQAVELAVEQTLAARAQQHTPTLTLIASKGTLDWGYPPFILATTAAALGWQVKLFFTFYGLNLLKKDLSELKVSPLGNPAMPMKMPFGPDWFQALQWNIPNLIQAGIPGFETLATKLMQQTIHNKGVAGIAELRALALEAEVEMTACQMTVDLFGYQTDDFIDGIDFAGAASFLPAAQQADVNLFV